MSKPKFRYDVYWVDIPADLSDDAEILAEQAITEARERAKLYCIPATWTAHRCDHQKNSMDVRFRVVRKRIRRYPVATETISHGNQNSEETMSDSGIGTMVFRAKKLFGECRVEFERTFGVALSSYMDVRSVAGIMVGFDITRFDDEVVKNSDKEGSMADAIIERWGRGAEALVRKLIRG